MVGCSRSAQAATASAGARHGLPGISGERMWTWIASVLLVYWLLFIAGAATGQRALNSVGGVLILVVLAWAALDRLWVHVDAAAIASLLAALIPLVHFFGARSPDSIEAYIKYSSVCIAITLARLLQLPEASTFGKRWLLAAGVLLVLVVSMTLYRGDAYDGGARHSGLFPNPNNLALIPFLLLFLVNRTRDSVWVRIGAHLIVMVVLAYTGTSGAIVAYAIGLMIHLRTELSRAWRPLFLVITLVGGLTVMGLAIFDTRAFLPETRLTNQFAAIHNQFETLLSGDKIAYYSQERVLGPGAGSALWRLAHWRDVFEVWADGPILNELIGFGPGSTTDYFGILPHNEYLRVLYESGVIGFGLFGFAFYEMIRKAPASVRYIGVIFVIYSFSENNLDNFPFMSLMVLCLCAKAAPEQIAARVADFPVRVYRVAASL